MTGAQRGELPDAGRRRLLRSALAAAIVPPALLSACARVELPRFLARPRLDAHAHLVTAELAADVSGRDPEEPWAKIDGQTLLGTLGGDGILQALAVSCAYLWASDFPAPSDPYGGTLEERTAVETENDYCTAQAALYPGRLVPFCSVNPKRSYALAEVTRCVEDGNARGLKLHFWNSNVSLREPRDLEAVERLLEYCAAREVPVLMHVFNGEVEDFGAADVALLAEVAAPRSGLRLCLAHLGGAGGYDAQVAEVVDALVAHRTAGSFNAERTWLDLSAVFDDETSENGSLLPLAGGRRRLAAQLRRWGPSRLLWGSDNEPDYLRATRQAWPLGEEEWQRVAEHNWTDLRA